MAVRVGRARRGVHVAVVGEVGLDRPQEVRAVLAVVGHERLDRVLVEAPHLVRVGGQGAKQEPVDAVPDSLLQVVDEALVAGDHLQHQLRLGDRARQLARGGTEGGVRRRPVRAQAAGEAARAEAWVRSGASSPPRAGRIA